MLTDSNGLHDPLLQASQENIKINACITLKIWCKQIGTDCSFKIVLYSVSLHTRQPLFLTQTDSPQSTYQNPLFTQDGKLDLRQVCYHDNKHTQKQM